MRIVEHLECLFEAVGKRIGNDKIYLHRSAIDTLPDRLKSRVLEGQKLVPKDFKWNFVITNPDYIAFADAENFDKAHEPVLGARYKVSTDGNVTFEKRKDKPLILHQRYKTVKADYKGFDQEKDKEREQSYRKHFDKQAMSGMGYEHKWKEAIGKIGLT